MRPRRKSKARQADAKTKPVKSRPGRVAAAKEQARVAEDPSGRRTGRKDRKSRALAAVAEFAIKQSTEDKQQAAIVALEAIREGPPYLTADSETIKAILGGASPDDAKLLHKSLARG